MELNQVYYLALNTKQVHLTVLLIVETSCLYLCICLNFLYQKNRLFETIVFLRFLCHTYLPMSAPQI